MHRFFTPVWILVLTVAASAAEPKLEPIFVGADGARTQLMAEAPCNFESDFKDDIDFWPDPKIHGFGTATGGDWAWVADNYVAGEGWHSDFQNGYTTQHGTHGRCGAGPM